MHRWLQTIPVAVSIAAIGCGASGAPAPAASGAASPPSSGSSTASSSSAPSGSTTVSSPAASLDFHYTKALTSSQTVEVYGLNGPIRAEGASSGMLEVRATKRVRRGDPASQRVVAASHPGGVVICVLYASEPDERCKPGFSPEGGHGRERHDVDDDDEDVAVYFDVRIPEGVAFTGATLNGGIDARGLRSDVIANTMNGGLDIATTGRIAAKTMNGAISATSSAKTKTVPIALETMNGSIRLGLPEGANFDLSASTMHGRITSEFPAAGPSNGFGPESLTTTIGRGGVPLTLRTMNGAIAIVRTR